MINFLKIPISFNFKEQIMKTINFPKRVFVSAGMPNGNKPLHIGHISNFIISDFYARYMRDRIGEKNVLYLCGTDGFGSSTEEKYRKLKQNGETDLTLEEYITKFHNIQKETAQKYHISFNRFYASCLKPAYDVHKEVSAEVFKTLLKNGKLIKRKTEQFFDEKANMVLNGRQVEGKCPIEGCKSEVGYADECSLGHQYDPKELINPISTITYTKPIFKSIVNYYVSLDDYRNEFFEMINKIKESPSVHKFMLKEMRDYLTRPALYVKTEDSNKLEDVSFKYLEKKIDENKGRIEFTFEKVADRDVACNILTQKDVRFATNKTLAPFRITGNSAWGVPVPQVEEDTKGLTFYVWPESLWAPISFTKMYLKETNSTQSWKDWWASKDCQIVQFLGEDNIYFYCLAQPAIIMGLNNSHNIAPEDGKIQISNFVPLKHILFNGIKASSSGQYRAPTTDELLDHYTYEQLRCHFLSMNVNNAAYQFKSKVFQPAEFEKSGDPVVAQGNMLTNIFNRIVRSVLYSVQTLFNGVIPSAEPQNNIIAEATLLAENYQQKVAEFKFSDVIILLDEYLRKVNQNWATLSKSEDLNVKAQLIADTLHAIKVCVPLLHPIAPEGSELVAKYFKMDKNIFNWDNIEKTYSTLYPSVTSFEFLPPKFDFFKKHPTQI